MERLVITMPIAPYKDFSVGKLSTPILAELLAAKLDAKFIIAINSLDSYKKRDAEVYKRLLSKYNIEPDEYWIDAEHIPELLNKIYYLIDKGFIYSQKKEVLSCNCKKVEISRENLSTINTKDACFDINNGDYYCKSCHSKCEFKSIDALVFNSNYVVDKELKFFPKFLNRDIKTFFNTVGMNEIIISRMRDTGIKVLYNSVEYNLDIDFLWGVYLSLFDEKEKIVICSNHQLYQLFMVLLLEKCFNTNSNTIALATPYLNINNKEKELELEDRIISLKLFSILNQRWTRKENTLDEGLLKYINSMNIHKKQMLYDIIIAKQQNYDLDAELETILTEEFNFQKAVKKMKVRKKNV